MPPQPQPHSLQRPSCLSECPEDKELKLRGLLGFYVDLGRGPWAAHLFQPFVSLSFGPCASEFVGTPGRPEPEEALEVGTEHCPNVRNTEGEKLASWNLPSPAEFFFFCLGFFRALSVGPHGDT